MSVQFEPTTSPEQILGFFMIYFGSMALLMAYFHCIEDSWKKSVKLSLVMIFLPWTVAGILALPFYAMTKYEVVKYRPLIAAASLIGAVVFFAGIHFTGIT